MKNIERPVRLHAVRPAGSAPAAAAARTEPAKPLPHSEPNSSSLGSDPIHFAGRFLGNSSMSDIVFATCIVVAGLLVLALSALVLFSF